MSPAEGPIGVVGGACPKRRPDLRARVFEGELVILDRERQLVHQLNQTASYIWHRCDGEHTVAAIATDVARDFDVDREAADRDVARAVRQLEAAGLVEMPAAGRAAQ
jgi:hypothetical protein